MKKIICAVIAIIVVIGLAYWLWPASKSYVAVDNQAQVTYVTCFSAGSTGINGLPRARVAEAVSGIPENAEITVTGGSMFEPALTDARVVEVSNFITQLRPGVKIGIETSDNAFSGVRIAAAQALVKVGERRPWYVTGFEKNVANLDDAQMTDVMTILDKNPVAVDIVIAGSVSGGESKMLVKERAMAVLALIKLVRPYAQPKVLHGDGQGAFSGVAIMMPAQKEMIQVAATSTSDASTATVSTTSSFNIGKYFSWAWLKWSIYFMLVAIVIGAIILFVMRPGKKNLEVSEKDKKKEQERQRMIYSQVEEGYKERRKMPVYFETDNGTMGALVNVNFKAEKMLMPPFVLDDRSEFPSPTSAEKMSELLTLVVNRHYEMVKNGQKDDETMGVAGIRAVLTAIDAGTIFMVSPDKTEEALQELRVYVELREESKKLSGSRLAASSAVMPADEAEALVDGIEQCVVVPVFFRSRPDEVMVVMVKKNQATQKFLPPFPFTLSEEIAFYTEKEISDKIAIAMFYYNAMSEAQKLNSSIGEAIKQGIIRLPENDEVKMAEEWSLLHPEELGVGIIDVDLPDKQGDES